VGLIRASIRLKKLNFYLLAFDKERTADGFQDQLPDGRVYPPQSMRNEHRFTLQVRVNRNKNAVENTPLSQRTQNLKRKQVDSFYSDCLNANPSTGSI